MKEPNLDFEVSRDFFIEMKYTTQNYLKKILLECLIYVLLG